jgi:hypothetical protein
MEHSFFLEIGGAEVKPDVAIHDDLCALMAETAEHQCLSDFEC